MRILFVPYCKDLYKIWGEFIQQPPPHNSNTMSYVSTNQMSVFPVYKVLSLNVEMGTAEPYQSNLACDGQESHPGESSITDFY